MKKTIVSTFAIGLLLSMVSTTVHARYYSWFDPSFFDAPLLDEMFYVHHNALDGMRRYSVDCGPSKEEKKTLQEARENLAKIKHDIKEDDTRVIFSLTGFESLDKKNVKVVKKERGWLGTITLKDGLIEFFIAPQGIEISRRIELKKEAKGAQDDQKDQIKECLFYSSSLATQVQYFKSLVDLSTLKAEPVTAQEFTLIVEKQKEEVLHLP